MPRSTRSVKRTKPKFRANLKNRKTAYTRKELRKKACKSDENIIKQAWDTRKTPKENLRDMGLAFNPNDIIPIIQPHRSIVDAVPIEGNIPFDGYAPREEYARKYKKKENLKAKDVIETLEKRRVEEEERNQAKDTSPVLPHRDVELCIYMIARYEDDYKAMSRDSKNLFQYTPKQMEKKIQIYKNSPFYKVIENF